MNSEQWARVKAQFHDVVTLAPELRRARLARLADAEPDIHGEVEALLEAHDTLDAFLEQPIDVDPEDLADVAGGPPAVAVEALPPGTRVGDYEIRREIGRGGMGVVYLAEDVHLSRLAALKALPTTARNDLLLQRFRREAQAAAAVVHPGVATVYALIDTPAGRFIASEFIAGRTLREEIERGALDPPRALRIVIDIVQALIAAHDAQVIHRDLKPENVLLTAGGGVKVIDFGVARIDREDAAALTAPGVAPGTPGYMAPEQLVAAATVDARADIYAAGVILAEMVLGAHPMERGARALPPALAPIVRRCLESDRERRYPSARDLLHDLERAARSLDAGIVAPSGAGAPNAPARWWWEFHQVAAAAAYWATAVPAWYAAELIGGRVARTLFFLTLSALLLASILRLHLWFIARTHPAGLALQRRREHRWIRVADLLFAASLLASGALLGESRMSLTVLLIAVAVGAAVIATFVEPSTTRAAFPESP